MEAFWGYIWPTASHLCPFCRTAHRNRGGTHDAWAYFNGCLSPLSSAPMCIGSFLLEDTLKGRWKPMTPPVIKLLERLSPKQEAREWLPAITIIYMAPGGHKQWPMSITALLDRLSWIVLQTRPLALVSFQEAVQGDPKWQPKYRSGPRLPLQPSIPYKFVGLKSAAEKRGLREGVVQEPLRRAVFCLFLCCEVIFSCKSHRNFFQKH